MSYVFEALATVTVIAHYQECPPAKLTTLECPVRWSKVGPDRTRVKLAHFLEGPKGANILRVILPDGLMVQGQSLAKATNRWAAGCWAAGC